MSYWSKLSMKDKADVMRIFLDKGISDLDTMRREYNIFAEGGDTNPGMTGMMKSKLATAAHFGNPTARRITNYDARSYTWPGEYEYDNGIGELKRGNVFVGSYGNLVTPQIQDDGKGLIFVDDVWSPENDQRSYIQSLKFSNEKDARYFGDHYKEIAPMMNLYSNGGKIHIKPSHRGRLTELKKRTGKSEAELYKTGGPAVRKMITFARNARKWKHGLGGNLYDDGGSYSYTKPLDNVYVDSEGNLLDPDVPSARGTVQLPEIIASTRDPRKPIPTAFSKDLNDAIFNISRHLMQYGRNKSVLAPINTEFNIIDNEPIESMAQATYLTPRNIQKQKFLEVGYTEAPRDYGLVKKAVGDRNIPVYQKRPDDEKRENLIAIGNIDTEWFGKDRAELRHAGSYPTAVYINPENSKVYQKAWDLNDYGGNTGTAKAYNPMRKLEANVIDKIGSPVVVTSGISEVDNENIRGSLESVLDDFMYNKGLTRYRDYIKEEIPMNNIHGEPMYNPDGTRVYMTDMKPFTYYGLPEVTVYGKMKKGTTYLLTPSIVSKKK